jgi:arylsulfatase A-like enzyme
MRMVVALLAALWGGSAVAAERPNIIVIVGDDMGYADVGIHGCKDIPTPNIDSLARSGVWFTNGYVSGPYCSPTRAGLITGRYQTRFGHEFNAGAVGLPLTETTLADRLKAAGYATSMVGKWHLGTASQFHPQKRGFDEFFGFLTGAHPYFVGKGKGSGILRGTADAGEKEYLTDAFACEAVAYVERAKAKPFFLYLTFNAVHTPMQSTDPMLKRFESIKDPQRRIYAGMMASMDDAIGKLLAKLREEKLEDNTLIFFISDNGGPTMRGTTINASSNAPLRGSKRTTLEGGVRVPFLIKWPGRVPAGKIYESPVIQLDILPTALAAAGVEVKPEWKLDGVDLLPYLTGAKAKKPHDILYWRFGAQMAIRKGDWKLVRYDPNVDENKTGINPAKLYNLADDIGESNDLAAKEPARVKELQAAWDEWNKGNVPPLWGGGGRKKKK